MLFLRHDQNGIIFCIFIVPHNQREFLVFIRAQELISGSKDFTGAQVRINQDVRVDSMLTRNINANRDYKGIDGFRIQIYRGSTRNAREEANKAKADFISEFPELNSIPQVRPAQLFQGEGR
ncbi:MAG: hypothetical protein R2744_09695 [Bacteroidales bacterium]